MRGTRINIDQLLPISLGPEGFRESAAEVSECSRGFSGNNNNRPRNRFVFLVADCLLIFPWLIWIGASIFGGFVISLVNCPDKRSEHAFLVLCQMPMRFLIKFNLFSFYYKHTGFFVLLEWVESLREAYQHLRIFWQPRNLALEVGGDNTKWIIAIKLIHRCRFLQIIDVL